MSYQFPASITYQGETFTLTNGSYRGVNSGRELSAFAAIDLTNQGINDPSKTTPNRRSWIRVLGKLPMFYNRYQQYTLPDGTKIVRMPKAKNIPETKPNPPSGWESQYVGQARTAAVIERYAH